jgi:hypothetical protein
MKRLIFAALLSLAILAIQISAASPLEARPLADTPTPAALETTISDADISLQRVHYVIEYDQAHIYLAEMYLFDNSGQRVYVGREGEDGRPETVRIALPPGAENVSSQEGGLDPRFKLTAGALIDTAPIYPGSAAHAIFFVYDLPYQGDTFTLEREAPYAVENVNILSADVGPQLSGGQLLPLGTRQAGGQNYQSYAATPLEKGARLVIDIGGLSHLRAATAELPAPAAQGTLRWLALGLAVLALVAAGAYPRLRQRPAGGEVGEVEAGRRKLLQAIADLDDAYQAGELAESGYRSQREQRKAELMALMRASDNVRRT